MEIEGILRGLAGDDTISRLRTALEFYANRETYAPSAREYWGGETEPCASPISNDMGSTARAALKRE